MEDIKDLLKKHLRLQMGHPTKDFEDFPSDIALEVYWDDELIAKTDSIYEYISIDEY